MRPKHYLKNILVILPLFFSRELTQSKIIIAFFSFFAFCLISSTIYIINDIFDVEKDKNHPTKCRRPIASGKISKKNAIIFATLIFIFSMILHFFSIKNFYSLATLYFVVYFFVNLTYSMGLKNLPILDVTLLASGFLIRTLYGGAVENVELSNWLYLTIITFSFYMGFGKRKGEIRILDLKNETRAVLKKYSYEFLDKNMNIFMTLILVFYSLWTVDERTVSRLGNNSFIWTVPLVIVICLRYSFVIENNKSSGDPVEVLSSDKILIIMVMIYSIITILLFYKNLIFQFN